LPRFVYHIHSSSNIGIYSILAYRFCWFWVVPYIMDWTKYTTSKVIQFICSKDWFKSLHLSIREAFFKFNFWRLVCDRIYSELINSVTRSKFHFIQFLLLFSRLACNNFSYAVLVFFRGSGFLNLISSEKRTRKMPNCK
jgi:hypothetical protein